MDKVSIGKRLEQARDAIGLSRQQVAARIRKSASAVAHHEGGIRGADAPTIGLYARIYKVSTDWIITGRGRGPTDPVDPYADLIRVWDCLPDENARAQALEILRVIAGRKTQ